MTDKKDQKEDLPLTEEEKRIVEILKDPVLWCETHLKNPDDPSKWLEYRWYQRKMVAFQPKKVWDEKSQKFVWKHRKKLYVCVHEDSQVMMADNTWKKIKDLQEGMSVVSYNDDGTTSSQYIIGHHNTGKKQLYKITTEDNNVIYATDDHKFYTNGSKETWHSIKTGLKPKIKLKVIDKARSTKDNIVFKWSRIVSIVKDKDANTYDIEVQNNHNFICEGIITKNCGRRVGKSICTMSEVLWLAHTNNNYKILVVVPYEAQLRKVWEVFSNMMGDFLHPKRMVQKPFIIEFSNGSMIKGFVGGVKQKAAGNRSSSMRSESADCIAVMEMDHGIDHVLKPVLLPIFLGKAHCRWIGDSSPSGQRGLMFQWATTPEEKGGAKVFHFPSSVSPEWNEDAEREARQGCDSQMEYEHEFEAKFGSITEGVYKADDLEEVLQDYEYNLKDVKKDCKYSMGVDWNQAFGVKIYIIEKNKRTGKYRTFYKHEVPNVEFTQTIAVDKIIELSKKVYLDYIYVDKGFGSVQTETLHLYGKDHPESRLHKIVKPIDFKSNIEIIDPWSKQKIKKPIKAFAIGQSARLVETHSIIIPESEDDKNALAGQLRGYKQYVTESDNVVFKAENRDDLLVAWVLGILAFAIEEGDFTKFEAVRALGHIPDPHGLEKKFARSRALIPTKEDHISILDKVAEKAGLEQKKWKKLLPGSEVFYPKKKTSPIGTLRFPLKRGRRPHKGQRSNRVTF